MASRTSRIFKAKPGVELISGRYPDGESFIVIRFRREFFVYSAACSEARKAVRIGGLVTLRTADVSPYYIANLARESTQNTEVWGFCGHNSIMALGNHSLKGRKSRRQIVLPKWQLEQLGLCVVDTEVPWYD
jgi:hypothetical protein